MSKLVAAADDYRVVFSPRRDSIPEFQESEVICSRTPWTARRYPSEPKDRSKLVAPHEKRPARWVSAWSSPSPWSTQVATRISLRLMFCLWVPQTPPLRLGILTLNSLNTRVILSRLKLI